MDLTSEQINIINTNENIKINATAGSGKTTTIVEYAKSRPEGSKILYLAFNKSVKLEAERKFRMKGLDNVEIETAHSLAHKNIVRGSNYKILNSYKPYKIKEILNIGSHNEKHGELILAKHIGKFASYFCNSTKTKLHDLDYLEVVKDPQAKLFVTNFYQEIFDHTRTFLAKMNKGEIEISHDFYLKKFQLSNPKLPYDYILFDEGQDASPVMLEVFLNQKATKVIVGDSNQQIYGWRQAVNSLEQVDYLGFSLDTSFRFHPDIASLAMKILSWKNNFINYNNQVIKGSGYFNTIDSRATIARTNLALLARAIDLLINKKEIKTLYFEGNFNSYTYGDDGASIYDVYNFCHGNKALIKDKLISGMSSIDDLSDYIEKTEDVELGIILEVVKEYGKEVPSLIKTIKSAHVDDSRKNEADMVFSTVHRAKGMEYDEVTVINDFITEEDINFYAMEDKKKLNIPEIIEDINLLYVAVTRTKNKLNLPEDLCGAIQASKINIIKPKKPTPSPIQENKSVTSKVKVPTPSMTQVEPEKEYHIPLETVEERFLVNKEIKKSKKPIKDKILNILGFKSSKNK